MARGRHRGPLPRILTGLPLCFVLLFAASGQAPLQHEVTVTLKLIQVFVTGPDGKPALGLDRSDFVLTDNGKPQTVTDFESHVLAVPAAERAVAVAAPAPVPVPAGEAPLLSRKFIFLIDYVRNVFEGVQKAKAAALDFLETKVGPDDEVGLFTLSPVSGLTLYEYLTTDHDKVRAKIKKLREFVGGGGASVSGGELMGMELLNAAGHGRARRPCRPEPAQHLRGHRGVGQGAAGHPRPEEHHPVHHGLRQRRRPSRPPQQRPVREHGPGPGLGQRAGLHGRYDAAGPAGSRHRGSSCPRGPWPSGRWIISPRRPAGCISAVSIIPPGSPPTSRTPPPTTTSSATASRPLGTASTTRSRSRSASRGTRSTPSGAITIPSPSPSFRPSKNIST